MSAACLAALYCQLRPGCSGVAVAPYVYLLGDNPKGKIWKYHLEKHVLAM